MAVQRTWLHLESIFIGSEDIRRQLPEDTERFEGIDQDFKVNLVFFYILTFLQFTYLSFVIIFQKHMRKKPKCGQTLLVNFQN